MQNLNPVLQTSVSKLPIEPPNLDLTIIYATYYYRWSTPGQIKERKFRDNKVTYDEKAIISEEIKKLEASIEQYRGFCSKCNKEIKVEFIGEGYADKGVSGRKIEREDIARLIESAREGKFQAVFTPYSSRLGRKASVAAQIRDTLKDFGVQIYSIHQPITLRCPSCFDPLDDDSAVITESISDLQAQLELSQIRRNYKNGMPVRIKSGKPCGSLAFGLVKKYRHVGFNDRGNEEMEEYYEWDEGKAKIVKRIAKEFLSGIGTWKIAQNLNIERIPSSRGKLWGRSAIYTFLKNPAYAGLVRFGWKPVKNGKRVIQPKENWMMNGAIYKGIWNETYYNKIQTEIERKRQLGGRAVSSEGLLIGLLKCADSKDSMFQTGTTKRRKNGQLYSFRGYACGTFLHRGLCRHNGIKQSRLDQIIVNEVLKLADEKTRASFYKSFEESKLDDYRELLTRKQNVAQNLARQLERANKAYMKGVDTLQEYSKNKAELIPMINTVQKEIAELQGKIERQPHLSWQKAYQVALERFKEYDSPQNKRHVRQILAKLIERIDFRKKPYSVKIYYKL